MTFEEIKENDNKYIVNMYGRFDMAVDHAVGATVFDVDGRKYIDMTSGIGVNSLGYGDQEWIQAVTEQLGKYQHTSNIYYHEPGEELAKDLVERSGMSKVLFVNSGSEANEAAFKIARKYGNKGGEPASDGAAGEPGPEDAASGETYSAAGEPGPKDASGETYSAAGEPGPEDASGETYSAAAGGKSCTSGGPASDGRRNTIISLKRSFHGRTIAAITATGQDKYHKDFDPFAPGFCYAEPGDIGGLSMLVDQVSPCALIMELVQGEGGVNVLDQEFVKAAAELCKARDIALIVDEVQTGIGRTGTLFAFEQFGIRPDMVTFAKGIGNGLPIGGVLCNEKFADVLIPGDHGCTFGMNPVCSAGARVVLGRIDDAFLADVRAKGSYIRSRLKGMRGVERTTGLGLMIGLVLKSMDPLTATKSLLQRGVMVLTAADKLRLLPPLTISYEEIDAALESMERVLN